MKKVWKIIERVLLTLVLTVYIIVALVNYSAVQSYVGALAGNYFSKEWGGKVRIGSLHAMPFDHLIVDDIVWISPTNDTICKGESIRVTFDKFPFDGRGLDLKKVHLKKVYYHLAINEEGINLKFLIDYFKRGKTKKRKHHEPFYVKAKTLILEDVHYRMDLKDHRQTIYPHGVQIPHMEFFHINAKMKDIKVVEDDVSCRIVRLATEERSGFVLKDMAAERIHVNRYEIVAKNMHIATGASNIEIDAELRYNTWKGIAGYVSTVQQKAILKGGTRVSMSDVAYWAPALWGIDAVVEAEGTATGTVDSITTDMMFRWGDNSTMIVAGTVVGLPQVDTTYFDVNLEHLSTNTRDLAPLLRAIDPKKKERRLVEEIDFVNLSATLKGGMKDDVTAHLLADCKMGQIRADISLHKAPRGHLFKIDAESEGINLSLLNSNWITRSGFSLSARGLWDGKREDLSQWNRHLEMAFDGQLTNSVVRGERLSAATVRGELDHGLLRAELESTDSLADLTLEVTANMTDEINNYKAHIDIENLDLGILPRPLATTVDVDLRGNNIEELTGSIEARNTHYGDLMMREVNVSVESDPYGKDIEIKSDMADADVRGMFFYTDLPLMIRYFGQKYVPEMFYNREPLDSVEIASLEDKTLAYSLDWKDDGRLLHTIAKDLTIAQGTRIDGSYNFGEQMKVVMRSDSVRFGSMLMENVGFVGRPVGDKYLIQTESQNLRIGRIEFLDHPQLTLGGTPSLGTIELSWGDNEAPSHGDVMLSLEGNKLRVTKPWFYVGDTPWKLDAKDLTLAYDKRLKITGDTIKIESQQQKIDARLSLRGEDDDYLEMFFQRFSIDLLSDLVLQETPLDAKGEINGRFSLMGINKTLHFNADLTVDSCILNDQTLGAISLNSNWNAVLNMLDIQMLSDRLDATGWIELGKKDPGITFKVDFHDFELATVEPMLSSFSSHFGGRLNGIFSISGTTSHPMIIGDAVVKEGELKIDFTNVTYRFSDSLMFIDNTVRLKDFDIHDPQDNVALANGEIRLTPDRDVQLDINVKTDNLILLDQKSGEQFYGRILAAADAQVSGPIDSLDIAVRAKTNHGCELTVPISYQQRIKSQNYITFVGDENPDEIKKETQKRKTDFNLTLDLSINDSLKLNLPMDFKELGANVTASGAGDLHIALKGNKPPQVDGVYSISSGLVRLGLFSVYEKRFTIENGSTLNFQGNVPDARFDMKAVYSQRVNLSTLTGTLSSVDNTQKYIQVENVIAIEGNLRDPSINFDIRLPNADPSVEEEVFAYIDRNSERDMMNQTFSLLIRGSFDNVNTNSQTSGGADALGVVSSFVGNTLTDMVQFVDVNIDYKSGNEYTNQQLDVNISKDWGRWYLESTLGYGGESRELESNNVNGAVIDALIGYRLSSVVHLYAYNRTNTNDYTRIDLPYKQGAGLKLTKDFDRWTDLFRAKKNRKKKQ